MLANVIPCFIKLKQLLITTFYYKSDLGEKKNWGRRKVRFWKSTFLGILVVCLSVFY